ncbi:hypothetical protein QTP88_012584 [Uroleucon formosanum]
MIFSLFFDTYSNTIYRSNTILVYYSHDVSLTDYIVPIATYTQLLQTFNERFEPTTTTAPYMFPSSKVVPLYNSANVLYCNTDEFSASAEIEEEE